MDFFPTKSQKRSMYDVVGVEDLFSDVPGRFICEKDLLGPPMSEIETRRHVEGILSKNVDVTSYKGGGAYDHYVPAHVQQIAARNEFYTSYTPYQPEISQGMLQALYEYQSLMSSIIEMPIVNASMYDWSTALGEAALMCNRANGGTEFIIPEFTSPERKAVLRSYSENVGITILEATHNPETGQIDVDGLSDIMTRQCGGVYIENPSYLGFFEESVDEISRLAHDNGSLFVVGVDPLSCGIVKGPGSYGADIVIGEASHLGNPINFGGPLLGLMAVNDDRKLVRTMPGRLIGLTEDLDGRPSYVMTLQTREQHIRREKATSNICTNESLCALSCAAYISSLGKRGFVDLAKALFSNASYAYDKIGALEGYKAPVHDSVHFREFAVRHPKSLDRVEHLLNEHAITGGIPVDGRTSIYCITDKHTKAGIDALVDVLGGL
ncbi:MAG: aminomethyl-transferring glycine dehydrogenase subunit GcvPA [Candidatus Methanofastidiosa archaeon]|nr:aminomethyl-transferring glycine dehydrogenase subunit GcvPA [Candidatus Methanofastidiosa archaeon]